MTTFSFAPRKEIREFDGRALEGVEVSIRLEHTDADLKQGDAPSRQYVHVEMPEAYRRILHGLGDWVDRVLGSQSSVITRTIRRCTLTMKRNGGRSDPREFSTYAEYFDEERKRQIFAMADGGLLLRMIGAGEPERCDVILRFDDFSVTDAGWDIHYPHEWDSERLKNRHQFKFVDGFYPNADAAIQAFSQKSSDDIFGRRFFPILVFPLTTDMEKVGDILWRPKTHSNPVVLNDQLIYGTRCKPDEYDEVIRMTYGTGGKVPVGVEWDW